MKQCLPRASLKAIKREYSGKKYSEENFRSDEVIAIHERMLYHTVKGIIQHFYVMSFGYQKGASALE